MHIYVLARAEKDRLEKWKSDLSSLYWPLDFIMPGTNLLTKGMIQTAVRPVQLFEVVVPKEAEAEIMHLINPTDNFGKFTKLIKWLGRLLGLNKVLPREKWKPSPYKNLSTTNVETIVVGTKPDEVRPLVYANAHSEEQL